MYYLDPRTNKCELEVQRIVHLQTHANQLPNSFIDTKKVTKSHISVANAPTQIDVLEGQLANESQIRLKCGKPISSTDLTPWKRRTQTKISAPKEANIKQKAAVEAYDEQETPIDESKTHIFLSPFLLHF